MFEREYQTFFIHIKQHTICEHDWTTTEIFAHLFTYSPLILLSLALTHVPNHALLHILYFSQHNLITCSYIYVHQIINNKPLKLMAKQETIVSFFRQFLHFWTHYHPKWTHIFVEQISNKAPEDSNWKLKHITCTYYTSALLIALTITHQVKMN